MSEAHCQQQRIMLQNDLLLRTLRGEQTERTPVWMMRQAGRYLPDYMKLKEKYSFFVINTKEHEYRKTFSELYSI